MFGPALDRSEAGGKARNRTPLFAIHIYLFSPRRSHSAERNVCRTALSSKAPRQLMRHQNDTHMYHLSRVYTLRDAR